MKQRSLHILTTLTGTLLLSTMLLLTGCDFSSEDPPEEEDTGAQVTVAEHATLGSYLTDAGGRSLYLFTDEDGNPVSCTGPCAAAWPPFLTEGEPGASGGADAALLGTTGRPDGAAQVVYNGWPLYYYAGDEGAGAVNGQGIVSFGGTWYLVSPAGNEIGGTGGNDDGGDGDGGGPY